MWPFKYHLAKEAIKKCVATMFSKALGETIVNEEQWRHLSVKSTQSLRKLNIALKLNVYKKKCVMEKMCFMRVSRVFAYN